MALTGEGTSWGDGVATGIGFRGDTTIGAGSAAGGCAVDGVALGGLRSGCDGGGGGGRWIVATDNVSIFCRTASGCFSALWRSAGSGHSIAARAKAMARDRAIDNSDPIYLPPWAMTYY